jgi:hypothetical protein
MADLKISQLGSIVTVVPATDVLPVVQGGTTYKVTPNQLLGAGGTATLASATITGDLTVRTNKLRVTSIGVGANTLTPAATLHSTQSSSYDALILDSDSASTYCTANWKINGVQKAQAFLDYADDSLLIRTNTATGPLKFGCNNIVQYQINPLGVFSWTDGAGGTRMTLNSTGLGIGNVPVAGQRLTVEGGDIYLKSAYKLTLDNASNNFGAQIYNIGASAQAALAFKLGATQAMTLDASGNLLVGTVTSPAGTKVGSIAKLSTVSIEGTASIAVSTTAVTLSRVSGLGGLFFVQGYADGSGTQAWWLVAANNTTTAVIASGNTTGLVPTFTIVGAQLKMVLVSGTFYATSFNVTA